MHIKNNKPNNLNRTKRPKNKSIESVKIEENGQRTRASEKPEKNISKVYCYKIIKTKKGYMRRHNFYSKIRNKKKKSKNKKELKLTFVLIHLVFYFPCFPFDFLPVFFHFTYFYVLSYSSFCIIAHMLVCA